MLEGKVPEPVGHYKAPLGVIAELAARLDVEGTPAIIFANGRRVDGHLPAQKIEAILKPGS